MDAESAEIDALRPTAWFQTHFERMIAPLRPGFARVCSMEYVEEHGHAEFPPALLERARADAAMALQSFEALVINTVEKAVVQFIKQPDMYGGQTLSWNASNAEDLETNISRFFDAHIGIWRDYEFDDYKERIHSDPTLTAEERNDLCFYVWEIIFHAAVFLPSCVREAEDVYYDSASTEGGDEA